jgi:hypothetical protein
MTSRSVSLPGSRGALSKLGRVGFVAKAFVYAVVATLALLLAFGAGGGTTDQQGAIRTLADEPGGMILLLVLGAGLIAYGVWRIAASLLDADGDGDDAGGLAKRLGHGISGGSLLFLGCLAFAIAAGAGGGLGGGGGGGGASGGPQQTTAGVLGWPGGPWIIGAVGVVLVCVALFQIYSGFAGKFMEDMDESKINTEWERRMLRWTGGAGRAALGVLLGLIGVFLLKAAIEHDPSEAKGLDGALSSTLEGPGGRWLLAVVALGLLAYAAFNLLQARYRSL